MHAEAKHCMFFVYIEPNSNVLRTFFKKAKINQNRGRKRSMIITKQNRIECILYIRYTNFG